MDSLAHCPPPEVPSEAPSIIEIKRAIPDKCFKPSLARSMAYVVKDLGFCMALYSAALVVDSWGSSTMVIRAAFYLWYWFIMGTMMWALFVLGHDCGHGSFSSNVLINDLVGNTLHSLILVPYYPWKLSHRSHHKNTGNIDRDEVFYPAREEATKGMRQYGSGVYPAKRPFLPLFGLGFGWAHYLMWGFGRKKVTLYHFNPWNSLLKGHRFQCSLSIGACVGWATFMVWWHSLFQGGWWCLVRHYLLPLFVFGSWLVVTTFLHHQDIGVPWYSDEKWDYVRGQVSSVDRHYGWAHSLVHNIGTHQVHHLFSKIPHYHLEEATIAFRRAFPHLVRQSKEPILKAFLRLSKAFRCQDKVPASGAYHVFREPS